MLEQGEMLARLAAAPVVFDGAMGTMLYERGVFINTCYDAVCLNRPQLVAEIHRGYVEAGAQVIETNSFGANPLKLGEHGLADQVEAINRAAAKLAREAAGERVWVAGAVGPCLHPRQMWQPTREAELRAAFAAQIAALVAGGVDLIMLETFWQLDELQLAAAVAKELGASCVVGSVALVDDGHTGLGVAAERVVARLTGDVNVDVLGFNCGTGPAPLYDALEAVIGLTGKPVVVRPNAGMPREVDGRLMFMTSPEYFASYARKFVKLGARAVGGCCGTTPNHIREVARAFKGLAPVRPTAVVSVVESRLPPVSAVPTAEKSRLGRRLADGVKVSSVELLPPKSCDLRPLLEKATACRQRGVDAINIPDGPRASARVSPMIAALEIERQVGIETVLHYCCRDRNLIGMQSDLLGGYAAGLRNLLIITGDPPKLGDYPEATGVFDVDAIGLTRLASGLNHGFDVGGSSIGLPTALLLGVGANPCAIAMDTEIERYWQKIEAGAEFAITQPIFDPDALFRFLDRVEDYPRRLPVIAGVWPLTSFKNAEFMRNEVPGVEVPDHILERMSRTRTKEDGVRVGIQIACEIRDRIADRVAGFQVSAPFGKVDLALAVLGF